VVLLLPFVLPLLLPLRLIFTYQVTNRGPQHARFFLVARDGV